MPDTTESSRATRDALVEAISGSAPSLTAGPQALEMQVGLRVSGRARECSRNPAKIARFANTPTWAVQHCQPTPMVGQLTPMVGQPIRAVGARQGRNHSHGLPVATNARTGPR